MPTHLLKRVIECVRSLVCKIYEDCLHIWLIIIIFCKITGANSHFVFLNLLLGGEKIRWTETVKRLDGEFIRLPGDCIAAQACICYLGPFISSYREELIKIWLKDIASRQIPLNEDFRLHEFMVEATDIREWNIQGSTDFHACLFRPHLLTILCVN